jgi:hypothetical protein
LRNILDSHIILNGEIYTEILDSDITDVSPSTIKQIAYRNSWVHISKNYNF